MKSSGQLFEGVQSPYIKLPSLRKKRRKTDLYHETRETIKFIKETDYEMESWQKIEKIRAILRNDSIIVDELKLFLSPDQLNDFCSRLISNYEY